MDLIDWLTGTWAVDRAIDPGAGTFAGTATFTREDDGGVRWEESGRLAFEAYDGPATRVLHVVGAGPVHAVRFEDGRPFHDLDLSSGACAAEHLCGPDTYRGEYVVESDDALLVTWRVTGPRKAHVIRSRYDRR